jgi:two-component system response regulator AtoC
VTSPRTTADAETRRLDPVRGRSATGLQLLLVGTLDGEAATQVPVGRAFVLPLGATVVLGREEGADLRVEHPSVSRRHASLTATAGVAVQDLGSANGTRVGDRALGAGERVTLHPGDLVEFGAVLCMVRGPAARAAPTPAPPDDAAGVVVASPAMRDLHALARRVAASAAPVLLLGETGVGKEVVAERIHAWSPRAAMAYVKVNCGNLTESLVEAELFGHERGAFTGAVAARAGLIEAAEGGTLFLDEVGELPPSMQTRLLRVLEDREVRRVGATKGRRVDVRFVAATNRDLEAEVAAGRFRADLFYRLNGFALEIPPLRERVEEIVPLALRFARKARAQLGLPGDAGARPVGARVARAAPVARQHPRAPQHDGPRGAPRRPRPHPRGAPPRRHAPGERPPAPRGASRPRADRRGDGGRRTSVSGSSRRSSAAWATRRARRSCWGCHGARS